MAFGFGKGTTPYMSVSFDGIKLDDVDRLVVTFYQKKSGVTLTLPDEQIHKAKDGYWFRLTQEQTLQFSRGTVKMQLRFRNKNTNAYSTAIAEGDIEDVLNEEVI